MTDMYNILLCIMWCVLSCKAISKGYVVPVLMWKNKDGRPHKYISMKDETSSEQFKRIILRELKNNPRVIVFAEKYLNHDNFFETDEDGEVLFPKLMSVISHLDHVTYLPGVKNPVLQIQNMMKLRWCNINLSKGSSEIVVPMKSNASLLITLDTKADSRTELLRRHDDIIVKIYTTLTKHHDTVLAVYTSDYSFLSTVEEYPNIKGESMHSELAFRDAYNPTLFSNEKIMLYSIRSPILRIKIHTHIHDLILKNASSISSEEGLLTVKVPENDINVQHLEFRYNRRGSDAWILEEVTVKLNSISQTEINQEHYHEIPKRDRQLYYDENITFRSEARLLLDIRSNTVESLIGLSYHCSKGAVFTDNEQGIQLIFGTIQTQPFLQEFKFGDAFDCIPFFTSGIIVFTCLTFVYFVPLLCIFKLMSTVQTIHEFEGASEPRLIIKKTTHFDTQ